MSLRACDRTASPRLAATRPACDGAPRPCFRSQPIPDQAAQHEATDHRQQAETSPLGVGALDDLEIGRDHEHHSCHRKANGTEGDRRPGETRVSEQMQVDQRCRSPQLAGNECDQDRNAANKSSQDPGAGPTIGRGHDDRVDDADYRSYGEDFAFVGYIPAWTDLLGDSVAGNAL